MTVDVSGEFNRAAARDFNENNIRIDQFDGCHTINIAIPSEPDNEDRRPLVKAQRRELNSLVAKIAEAGDNEAYVVWQKVHAEVGVSSIDEMTIDQYQVAVSFLEAMLERCKEKDASRAMVSLLLRNTPDSETRQKLIRYCNINFGTSRLNDLTRAQLQMALSWLEELSQGTSRSSSSPASVQFGITDLLRNYPKEIGLVFIVAFVMGALIF